MGKCENSPGSANLRPHHGTRSALWDGAMRTPGVRGWVDGGGRGDALCWGALFSPPAEHLGDAVLLLQREGMGRLPASQPSHASTCYL